MPGVSLLSSAVSPAASGIAGSSAPAGCAVAASGAALHPVGCLSWRIHSSSAWKGRSQQRQQRYFASASPEAATRAVGEKQGDGGSWRNLSRPEKLDKAKSAALAMTNLGVVAFGLVVFGSLTYAVGSELFSPDSSTSLYSDALERIRNHPQARAVIGTPIAGFGKASRRRATRPAYQYTFDAAGREHMLLTFYIKGSIDRGTAFLDCIKNEEGHWEFESLYVDVPDSDQPSKRIVIIPKPQQGYRGVGTRGLLGNMARRVKSLWGSTHSIPMPEPKKILE